MQAPEHKFDIEALIERSLSSQPMIAVPMTLRRRVEERVRIAALRERQRARFRYSMVSFAMACVGAILLAGAIIDFTTLWLVRTNGVPGGLGTYDLYANSMTRSASGYSGAYSLIFAMFLAGATLLLGIVPLRHVLRNH